jgi:RimJ/RimL family protein N-acetyltransferase
MNFYKCLNTQEFVSKEYKIVPIRLIDSFDIMKWRNEQMYHLRQKQPLTVEDQENYFSDVVSKLFVEDQPNQILFSFLENGKCIGYGGLVHINWIDRNAEISFIMNTTLEKTEFKKHWTTYLGLIEQVAFEQLNLHKLYVYAFDLRPHLYDAIESSGYKRDAVLKEHCFALDSFKDVVIHSKWNSK